MFRTIDLFRRMWSAKESSSVANPKDPEGLHVVSPHHGEEEASVDIVAVHGLGGNPYDTWTHDNGIMWLRDLLPLDISDVRIMTWGYDSEAQTAKHFIRMMMCSHPDDLLSALNSLRQDTKSNNRPIIFVCHSLGGVVVKEALLRASMAIPKNKEDLKMIQICTKGIIFLGTPQQSTRELSLGEIIRHLASSARNRERLLKSMDIASDRLELQLDQFKSICTGLSNYYCYERRPTRNSLGVDFIISKASATMSSVGTEDSHCVGLDKDHLNMVKYDSNKDPDYKLVLDLVCRLRKSNGWTGHIEGHKSQAQNDCLTPGHRKANFKVPAILDHHRNGSFTGRKGALTHLHSSVSSSHSTNDSSSVVVIHGIGGVGKTQLAREYVYRFASSFDSVWWIDAQSLHSTYTGFFHTAQRLAEYYASNPELWAPAIADISCSLNIENPEDVWGENQMDMKQPALIVEAVKEWLCCNGNDHWLLIFDNVDDLETFNIADFVPETRSGSIIMTSRCKEVSRFGQDIFLDVMGESESISLLSKSCRRDTLSSDVPDYAEAAELVAALGHLPLAIVQAGADISRLDLPFASYLKAFTQESLQDETVLNSRLIGLDAVYTTWELNFQTIKEQSPQAADLLLLCSFLSPENIPEEMLSSGLQLKGKGESSLKSQLAILSKYSLIMPSERVDSFNIHYLVHTWARDRQTPGQRRSNVPKAVVVIATAADTVREPESRRRVFERQILPHIRHCLDYLLPASVSSVGYHYWSILGSVCKHQDQHEDAEKLYGYAKEDLDGKSAFENEKAMVLLQLASIFIARGKMSEAEGLSRQVLEQTEKMDLRLLSLINLASVYEFQGQFQEAEQYLKEALDQCEHIFGPNGVRTLRLVDHLATMYQKQGQYERAEFLLRRELLSFEAHVGSDHPETMMVQGKLALLCEGQCKYEEMETFLERSLNAHERVLGSDHPKTLSIVASLAATYDLQGSLAESHPLYVRALEGTERMLGSKHRATLNIRENMALNCYAQGKYKKAEEMFRNILEVRLSQTHNVEEIERTRARLAESYEQQGSEKEVLKNRQRRQKSWLLW